MSSKHFSLLCKNLLSGLVVRVSALRLEGRDSILSRVILKATKMVPSASLLDTQHQGLDWGYVPAAY